MLNENFHHPYYHKVKIPFPDNQIDQYLEIIPEMQNKNLVQQQIEVSGNLWKNDDINLKLKKIELYPSKLRFFYWKNYDVCYPWHIDGDPERISMISINWVIDGGGKIQWSSEDYIKTFKPSKAYLASLESKLDDKFVAETPGNGYLINTEILHRVLNDPNQSRISLTLQYYNHGFPFFEAVERLKSVDLLY